MWYKGISYGDLVEDNTCATWSTGCKSHAGTEYWITINLNLNVLRFIVRSANFQVDETNKHLLRLKPERITFA